MTVPTFLGTTFRYKSTAGVTDVATIITTFRDEVLNQLPVGSRWTEPSADLFKSVVDADGRFFDVLLTRVDVDTLEIRVRNPSAVTIATRRVDIDGAGTEVRIYSGPYHADIESVRATPESAGGGLMDLSPESQISHSNYVYAYGYRDNAGAIANQTNRSWFILDNGVAAVFTRLIGQLDASGIAQPLRSGNGANIFRPAELFAAMSGANRIVGRMFQRYMCDSGLALGTEHVVPIDDATTATFKVLGRPDANAADARIAVRKA